MGGEGGGQGKGWEGGGEYTAALLPRQQSAAPPSPPFSLVALSPPIGEDLVVLHEDGFSGEGGVCVVVWLCVCVWLCVWFVCVCVWLMIAFI